MWRGVAKLLAWMALAAGLAFVVRALWPHPGYASGSIPRTSSADAGSGAK